MTSMSSSLAKWERWKTELTSVSYWLRLTPSMTGRFSSPWMPEGQIRTRRDTFLGYRAA